MSTAQKIREKMRRVAFAAALAFFPIPLIALAQTDPQSKKDQLRFSGPPSHLKKGVPAEMYEKFSARKLRNPETIWVSRSWLNDHGFSVMADQPIPEAILQRLAETFGYSVPQPGDSMLEWAEESKDFYSDRYGGEGMADHLGSGRNGSTGDFNVKGIGITPLRKLGNSLKRQLRNILDHANGRVGVSEGLIEAIHSEINFAELPYGSNRVVAVIRTRLKAKNVYGLGGWEDAVLIVRENDLRPAHLMFNHSKAATAEEAVQSRKAVEEAWRSDLLKIAGLKENSGTLNDALFELTARVAKQHAVGRVRGIFHGAISPSNITLDGREIDFGTQDYNSTFRAIQTLLDAGAMKDGDPAQVFEHGLGSFLREIPQHVSNKEARLLPKPDALKMHFMAIWNQEMREGLLEVTGIPSTLRDSRKTFESAQELASHLQTWSELEGKLKETSESSLNLKTLMMELAMLDNPSPETVQKVVARQGQRAAETQKLAEAYCNFITRAEEEGAKQGLTKAALRKLAQYRTRIAFSPRTRRAALFSGIKELRTKLGSRFWTSAQTWVDQTVSQNRRFESGLAPDEALVSRGWSRERKGELLAVYSAKDDRIEIRTKKTGALIDHSPTTEWEALRYQHRLQPLAPIRTDEPLPSTGGCLKQTVWLKLLERLE